MCGIEANERTEGSPECAQSQHSEQLNELDAGGRDVWLFWLFFCLVDPRGLKEGRRRRRASASKEKDAGAGEAERRGEVEGHGCQRLKGKGHGLKVHAMQGVGGVSSRQDVVEMRRDCERARSSEWNAERKEKSWVDGVR
jgi:hypothetical protein